MSDPAKNHRDNSNNGDNSDLTMDSEAREIAISFPADSPELAEFRDDAKMQQERKPINNNVAAKNNRDNSNNGDNSDLTMDSEAREIAISFPADSPELAEFRDDAKVLQERKPINNNVAVKNNRDNSNNGDNSDLTMDSEAREIAISFPADSPELAEFRDDAKMLQERKERHERLIQLSHEITIEFKKVKVLFHSPTTMDSSEDTVTEMQELIQKLVDGPIKHIGLELEECCPEEFDGDAVTAGFQEYSQARIMLSLMTDMIIISYPELQKELEYTIIDNDNERLMVTKVPESDYMLGLADITGELMKKVINSISNGDTEECFVASRVLVELCTWYLNEAGDDSHLLDCKLPEIRANMDKVEQALYGLCARSGDMPPHAVIVRTLSELGELGDWEDLLGQSDNDDGYDYY